MRDETGFEGSGFDAEAFVLADELAAGAVLQDSTGQRVALSLDGKLVHVFPDRDAAEQALATCMERDGYFPNVFHVNERGNASLLSFVYRGPVEGRYEIQTDVLRSWV